MAPTLDPKELARIKRAARAARIHRIRRRVAVFGASLAALFSGTILAKGQLDQQPAERQTVALTRPATIEPTGAQDSGYYGSDDDHRSDDSHDSNDDSEHGDSAGILQTVTDAAIGALSAGQQTSAPSPAPTPAPLTTSQS